LLVSKLSFHLLNKEDEMVYAKRISNGETIDSKAFFEKKKKGSSLTERVEESCMEVPIHQYIYHYNVRANGVAELNWIQYVGVRYETSCEYNYFPEALSSGFGGGTYGGAGPAPYAPCDGECLHKIVVEEEEDKIVIDPTVIPWVEDIIKLLQEKDKHHSVVPDIITNPNNPGMPHISHTILDLFDNSKMENIKFKIADATSSTGAKRNAFTMLKSNTPSVGQWTAEITIDKNYAKNGTKLALARTIIHESIHAYLAYLYNLDPIKTPFMQLLDKHRVTLGSTNLGDHEFMTQYAEAIGLSLAAWDNHSINDENYYEYLAWSGGMLNSPSFSKLSKTKQALINNANEAEGNSIKKATKKAKGVKCP